MVQSIHEDGLYEEPPAMVYWPTLMADCVRRARDRNAGRHVRRPQRARRHREPRGGDPAGGPVGEREHPGRGGAHDARPLRRLARAHVVHARDARDRGRHGACCSASSASTASSPTSSRRGLGKSAFARRSAPSRGNSRRCSCCTGSRLSAVGAVVGLVAAVALGAFDVVAVVRHRPDGSRGLCCGDRRDLAAAALASYLPARRAAKIDPIETLRAE